MNTSKIIRGVVSNGRYTVTAPIVKEDYGLYLKIEGVELPQTYEVDFSNSENNGTSVTMIGNADGVLIPRQFIDSGKDIFAFLYHVGEDFGRTVYKFRIPNKVRPDRTNEEPTPEEQSVIDQTISALNDAVESAQEAQEAIENMSVSATTLAEGSSATVTKTEQEGVVHLEFGIPKGQTGDSPTITASKTGKTTSIYVDGSEVAQIEDGTDGINGIDGISPSVSVTDITGGHRVVITDKDGEKSFDVEDGATGATPNLTIGTVETLEPAESATASITGTPENPVLNLGIPQGEQGEVTLEEFYKAFVTDTASGSIASFSDGADDLPLKSLVVDINPIQDLSNGDPSPENICPISGWTGMQLNANGTVIPISWQTEAGTVYGGSLDVLSGVLTVDRAMVDLGTLNWSKGSNNVFYAPYSVNPQRSSNAKGYPYISSMWVYGPDINAIWSGGTNGLAVEPNGISSTPRIYAYHSAYANMTTSEFKTAMNGVQVCHELVTPITIQLTPHEVNSLLGQNNIFADTGDTEVEYRADPDLYIQRKMPEVPVDDVQINGTSIVTDGVANVPVATGGTLGVVKAYANGGIILSSSDRGQLLISAATDAHLKAGNAQYKPVVTANQHSATFYGLAKAASDTTQSQSSNAVGQYTDEAKVAIQKMLGLYKAPYRLIKTIEITEETGTITIVADDNGNAFALTDVIVFFEAMVATGTSNGIVSLNTDTLADRPFVTVANLYNTTAQTRDAILSVDGGRFIGQSSGSSFPNSYNTINQQQNKNACGIIQHDIIDTLIIGSLNSHKFTGGTITIYGR